MSAKGKLRSSRRPTQKKTSSALASRKKKIPTPRSARAEEEILSLVRKGVERFILKNATVEDFLRAMRAVGKNEKVYAHQLTRSVFARIVKEAIRKRNLGRLK